MPPRPEAASIPTSRKPTLAGTVSHAQTRAVAIESEANSWPPERPVDCLVCPGPVPLTAPSPTEGPDAGYRQPREPLTHLAGDQARIDQGNAWRPAGPPVHPNQPGALQRG